MAHGRPEGVVRYGGREGVREAKGEKEENGWEDGEGRKGKGWAPIQLFDLHPW